MNTPLQESAAMHDRGQQLERDIAELNQRLIERQESFQAQLVRIEETWREKLRESQAQVVAMRDALTQYREAFSDGPENCGCILYEKVDEIAAAALSTPPPPVVPLADVLPLVEALRRFRDMVLHERGTFAEENIPVNLILSAFDCEIYNAVATLESKHPLPQAA